MRAVQNKLEDTYADSQAGIESAALAMYEKDPAKAKEFLTNYTEMTAQCAVDSWKKLGEYIIVKYNDMVVKPEKNGKFMRTPTGIGASVKRPGYPDSYKQQLIEQTGDKYLVPTVK